VKFVDNKLLTTRSFYANILLPKNFKAKIQVEKAAKKHFHIKKAAHKMLVKCLPESHDTHLVHDVEFTRSIKVENRFERPESSSTPFIKANISKSLTYMISVHILNLKTIAEKIISVVEVLEPML